MKQVLLDFIRCQGLSRKGKKCHYRARYGKFCGHHTSHSLQARYLFNAVMKTKWVAPGRYKMKLGKDGFEVQPKEKRT